ncbi:MAG: RDD family protein, partial [Candidatus Eremiobacteraeota bacterium]|nr:RDD family protein [Candidatus Eremiobacteraeota bacterium]
MNEPPIGPDPYATQPIPVTPMPPPSRQDRIAPSTSVPVAFTPRFGNVPVYLFARFLAFMVDIVAIAFAIAAFGFNTFGRGFIIFAGRDEGGFVALAGASFGAALLFAFLCEALFSTTLGKLIFGLHVRRARGGHAGVARVFVRYLLRPIDLLAIGPLLALVTPRHQRLGDFMGGTVVSRTRFGPLVSVLGIALLAGILYAQFTLGGGLDSALGVAAEAANYGPDLIAKSAALAGIAVPHAPVALPAATPTPSAAPTIAATAAPSATP